jgi:hypothetical protein
MDFDLIKIVAFLHVEANGVSGLLPSRFERCSWKSFVVYIMGMNSVRKALHGLSTALGVPVWGMVKRSVTRLSWNER